MNIQVYETTGHSPYELVFGQKPHDHATIFPGGDETTITNEEDLELDGIVFESNEVRHNLYLDVLIATRILFLVGR